MEETFMSYCTKCGTKIVEGSAFCSNCGNRVETPVPAQTESQQQAVNAMPTQQQVPPVVVQVMQPTPPVPPMQQAQPVQQAFPTQSVQPTQPIQHVQHVHLAKYCTQCGYKLAENNHFCPNCGYKAEPLCEMGAENVGQEQVPPVQPVQPVQEEKQVQAEQPTQKEEPKQNERAEGQDGQGAPVFVVPPTVQMPPQQAEKPKRFCKFCGKPIMEGDWVICPECRAKRAKEMSANAFGGVNAVAEKQPAPKKNLSGLSAVARVFMILTGCLFVAFSAFVLVVGFISCGCAIDFNDAIWNGIASLIAAAIFLIPLLWIVPMTKAYTRKVKNGERVSIGFKVCTLLFCGVLAGIFMLCDTEN